MSGRKLDGAVATSADMTSQDDTAPSIWQLVQGHLPDMINRAIVKANHHMSDENGLLSQLGGQLKHLLNSSLKHVGYGQGLHNDTVRQEVKIAVQEATKSLNLTQANSTFNEILAETLDQEIELDAFGQIINSSSKTLQDTDFFHKMPIKDETLFVALVSMAVILPIIFATLLGIFFYKRRQDNKERRQEMLLKDQPEFSMDEYTSGDSNDKNEDDIPDLDLKSVHA